jgi:DNA-binding LacI/PurR family transcriptional regulator
MDQMGEKSVKVMIELLENPKTQIKTYELPIDLIVRQST